MEGITEKEQKNLAKKFDLRIKRQYEKLYKKAVSERQRELLQIKLMQLLQKDEEIKARQQLNYEKNQLIKREIKKYVKESQEFQEMDKKERKEAIQNFEQLIELFENEDIDYTDYDRFRENKDIQIALIPAKGLIQYLFQKGILKNVKKSETGGSYYILFQQKETEDYYCPNSFGCFFSCIEFFIKKHFQNKEIDELNETLKKYNELRYQFTCKFQLKDQNMPQCKISDFIELLCQNNVFFSKDKLKDINGVFVYDVIIKVKKFEDDFDIKTQKINQKKFAQLGPSNSLSQKNLFRQLQHFKEEDQKFIHQVKLINYKQHYFLQITEKASQQILIDYQDYQVEKQGFPMDIKLFNLRQNELLQKYQTEQDEQKQKKIKNFFNQCVVIYDIECAVQRNQQQIPYSCCCLIDTIVVFDLQRENFEKINQKFLCKQQQIFLEKENLKLNKKEKIYDISKEKQKLFWFEGIDCVQQMLLFISQYFIENSLENSQQCKSDKGFNIYMFAHNSQRYDNYVILDNIPKDFQIKDFSQKQDSSNICLTLKTRFDDEGFRIPNKKETFLNDPIFLEQRKNKPRFRQYFKFLDTFPFLPNSLKKLCQDYKVPLRFFKIDLKEQGNDITAINLENYKEKRQVWLPYLINDVLSLSYIYNITQKNIFDIDQSFIYNYQSINQYSFRVFQEKYGGNNIQNFENNLINQFFRKFIRAGRVFLGQTSYKIPQEFQGCKTYQEFQQLDKDNQFGLIALDYTSLYPSACIYDEDKNPSAQFLVPDLSSVYIFQEDQLQLLQQELQDLKYLFKKVFFLVVDYFIPEENVFTCNVNKIKFVDKQGIKQNKTVFNTGFQEKQYLTSIQLEDSIRYNGAKIIKIHYALTFKKYLKNYFQDYMIDFYKKRKEIQQLGKEVQASIIKQQMNSVYGKTIQKEMKYNYRVFRDIQDYIEQKQKIEINQKTFKQMFCLNNQIIIQEYKEVQDLGKSYAVNGVILLAISQRLMNDVIYQIDGFKQPRIYYMDTDSMYIERQFIKQIDQKFISNKGELLSMKNDFGETAIIIKADFLMKKVKRCIILQIPKQLKETDKEYGKKQEGEIVKKLSFKGINKELWNDELFDKLLEEKKIQVQKDLKIMKRNFKIITGGLVQDSYYLQNNFNLIKNQNKASQTQYVIKLFHVDYYQDEQKVHEQYQSLFSNTFKQQDQLQQKQQRQQNQTK